MSRMKVHLYSYNPVPLLRITIILILASFCMIQQTIATDLTKEQWEQQFIEFNKPGVWQESNEKINFPWGVEQLKFKKPQPPNSSYVFELNYLIGKNSWKIFNMQQVQNESQTFLSKTFNIHKIELLFNNGYELVIYEDGAEVYRFNYVGLTVKQKIPIKNENPSQKEEEKTIETIQKDIPIKNTTTTQNKEEEKIGVSKKEEEQNIGESSKLTAEMDRDSPTDQANSYQCIGYATFIIILCFIGIALYAFGYGSTASDDMEVNTDDFDLESPIVISDGTDNFEESIPNETSEVMSRNIEVSTHVTLDEKNETIVSELFEEENSLPLLD